MLEVHGLHVGIGAVSVLRGLSLNVPRASMVGLVGPNGAGKTTLVRAIMGHLPVTQGSVYLDGEDLLKLPPHLRASRGIGYMPEDRGLVPELTVDENILLPLWASRAPDLDQRLAMAYGVLPELLEMRSRKAMLLSGGQQKLVALARALVAGTRLLVLDEPFEGVAPALSKRLAEVIASLKGGQLSVLLAQSDLNHARRIVDHEFTIERGANALPATASACTALP